MRQRNCPPDKGVLSLPWQPHTVTREKGPTELFVTRQSTCYKWKPLLLGLLGRGRRRRNRGGHLANTGLLFWQARKYFRKTRRGLATQSEAKTSKRALKFARGLGFTLQLPLCTVTPWGKMCPPNFLRCVSGSETLRRIFQATGYQEGSATIRRWLLFFLGLRSCPAVSPSQSQAIVVLKSRVRR